MKFWEENKIIIIVLLVVLIVFIIWYIGRRSGQSGQGATIPLPQDDTGGVATGTGANQFNPSPYTDAIYNDLDTVFGFHSTAPYTAANSLSNYELAAVWNDWQVRYYAKFDNQTMTQAIQNDFSYFGSYNAVTEALVKRLKAMGRN